MFFQSYYTGSLSGDFRIYDDCNQAFRDLFMNMFVSMKMRGSHPLPGLDKRVLPVVRHAANTVFMLPRVECILKSILLWGMHLNC